jgi:hypothetical protein
MLYFYGSVLIARLTGKVQGRIWRGMAFSRGQPMQGLGCHSKEFKYYSFSLGRHQRTDVHFSEFTDSSWRMD